MFCSHTHYVPRIGLYVLEPRSRVHCKAHHHVLHARTSFTCTRQCGRVRVLARYSSAFDRADQRQQARSGQQGQVSSQQQRSSTQLAPLPSDQDTYTQQTQQQQYQAQQYNQNNAQAIAPQYPSSYGISPQIPVLEEEVYLARSQLIGKQVVTRTTGRSLGYISQMFVDTNRMELVYLDLKATQLATETTANILLSSLRQIGDVVLVHDDSVLYDEQYGDQYGYSKLVSSAVVTEAGVSLGKVRDYLFNPDNGQISRIQYDAFGLPLLPASLVRTFSLGVDMIVSVNTSKVIVRAGSEEMAVQETEGSLDTALMSVLNFFSASPDQVEQDANEYLNQWRRNYEEWEAKYGAAYRAKYGNEPPLPNGMAGEYSRGPGQVYQPPSPAGPLQQVAPPQGPGWRQGVQQQQEPQQGVPPGRWGPAPQGPPLQLPQPSGRAVQEVFDFGQNGRQSMAGQPIDQVIQPSQEYAYQGTLSGLSRRQQRAQRAQRAQQAATGQTAASAPPLGQSLSRGIPSPGRAGPTNGAAMSRAAQEDMQQQGGGFQRPVALPAQPRAGKQGNYQEGPGPQGVAGTDWYPSDRAFAQQQGQQRQQQQQQSWDRNTQDSGRAAAPAQRGTGPSSPSRANPRGPLRDPRFRGNRANAAAAAAAQSAGPMARNEGGAGPPPNPMEPPQYRGQVSNADGSVSIRAFELPRDNRAAFERRDVDGKYGEQPARQEVVNQRPDSTGLPIEQWLKPAPSQARVPDPAWQQAPSAAPSAQGDPVSRDGGSLRPGLATPQPSPQGFSVTVDKQQDLQKQGPAGAQARSGLPDGWGPRDMPLPNAAQGAGFNDEDWWGR